MSPIESSMQLVLLVLMLLSEVVVLGTVVGVRVAEGVVVKEVVVTLVSGVEDEEAWVGVEGSELEEVEMEVGG